MIVLGISINNDELIAIAALAGLAADMTPARNVINVKVPDDGALSRLTQAIQDNGYVSSWSETGNGLVVRRK